MKDNTTLIQGFEQRREQERAHEFAANRINEIIGFLLALFICFPLFLIWVCVTWIWELPGKLKKV